MALTYVPFLLNPTVLATADLAAMFSVTGTVVISSGNGRNGGNSIRAATGSNLVFNSVSYALPTNMPTVSFNAAVKISALPSIGFTCLLAQFYDASTLQVTFGVTNAGQIVAYRGLINTGTLLGTSSGATLIAGVQNHVELQATIHPSAGTIKVWINGTSLVLNLSSQNTRQSSNSFANSVLWGAEAVGSGMTATNYDYSDLHIADDQVGDNKLVYVTTNGAGAFADFTNVGGASNDASVADAQQDGDTSYVSSSTIGQHDSNALANLTGSPTITAVAPFYCAKKTDAGTRKFKPLLRISSTNYLGTELSPGTTYRFFMDPQLVSPATAIAYTPSEINGLELGQEVSA